jgi:hypothetical protein
MLKERFPLFALTALTFGLLRTASFAQSAQDSGSFDWQFRLSSSTFENDTFMPLSTINNIVQNGTNACSINGAPGGNESPELFWTGAPPWTKTFVVTLFDVTASFTHWGMYNISGNLTGLPQNAGVAGSKFGTEILNDFGSAAEYDGPCPPPGIAPYVHRYVFTVYALDVDLHLPGSTNFPSNAESLYQALIKAGEHRHILASATLIGLYSTTASH